MICLLTVACLLLSPSPLDDKSVHPSHEESGTTRYDWEGGRGRKTSKDQRMGGGRVVNEGGIGRDGERFLCHRHTSRGMENTTGR